MVRRPFSRHLDGKFPRRIPPKLIRIWTRIEPYVLPYGHSSIQLRRSFKAAITTAFCFALSCITKVNTHMGGFHFYCAMLSVPMNPGRRLGGMIQTVILGLSAVACAIGYGVLTHFCAQRALANTGSEQRAYDVIIGFEIALLIIVGYIKSAAPRLFTFNFVFFMLTHFMSFDKLDRSVHEMAFDYSIPTLMVIAVSFFVNLVIFPEFGSTFIGSAVYDNVHELEVVFSKAIFFFTGLEKISNNKPTAIGMPSELQMAAKNLRGLVKQKKKLRACVTRCAATLLEASYEISYSYMDPVELRPTVNVLQRISTTTSALLMSCELSLSIFSGINDQQDVDSPSTSISSSPSLSSKALLATFITSIKNPVENLAQLALDSLNYSKCILAHVADVDLDAHKDSNLFSTTTDDRFAPLDRSHRASMYELSVDRLDVLSRDLEAANEVFGTLVRAELAKISDKDLDLIYLIPQEEYFVLSLFILNFKEASVMVAEILANARHLLVLRQEREAMPWWKGRCVWFSFFNVVSNWAQYLSLGSDAPPEGDEATIVTTLQRGVRLLSHKKPIMSRVRHTCRDVPGTIKLHSHIYMVYHALVVIVCDLLLEIQDWARERRVHLHNAVRLTLAVMAVSFPGYVVSMTNWYHDIKGHWVGFAAFVALESNVGATFLVGIIRTATVTIGSAWGYALYAAGDFGRERYLMVAMTFIGTFPFFYFLLFSSYGRAGIIGIISLVVVPLSTLSAGTDASILQNFAKRCLSILIGGAAATLANIVIYPQKARVQLVGQLIFALKSCQQLQIQLAIGIDGKRPMSQETMHSVQVFDENMKKANNALTAAESLVEIAKKEIRFKGSFKREARIYTEIIFVLHQILDQYSNMRFLREHYGLVQINEWGSPSVVHYRKEVFSTIIALLRTTESVLYSKSPVPQYIPSARIAHTRVVNAVRANLLQTYATNLGKTGSLIQEETSKEKSAKSDISKLRKRRHSIKNQVDELLSEQHQMLRVKYMCWSACSVALEEVIVYVEELVHLTKFLVGVQESGLKRKALAYDEWATQVRQEFDEKMNKGSKKPPSPPGPSSPSNEAIEFPHHHALPEKLQNLELVPMSTQNLENLYIRRQKKRGRKITSDIDNGSLPATQSSTEAGLRLSDLSHVNHNTPLVNFQNLPHALTSPTSSNVVPMSASEIENTTWYRQLTDGFSSDGGRTDTETDQDMSQEDSIQNEPQPFVQPEQNNQVQPESYRGRSQSIAQQMKERADENSDSDDSQERGQRDLDDDFPIALQVVTTRMR